MPARGTRRDPLLDCPNVKSYREIIHLQLNYIQRQYVVDKISCCERGQRLWKTTLHEIMLNGNNPRNVPYMVKLWENAFYGVEGVRFQQYRPNGNGVNPQYSDRFHGE
jgi:hypothetical protein